MKAAALLQKVHYLDPLAISAWKVLEMATRDGAKALGMENEIGSIKIGYRADLILLDLHKPNTSPTFDPVSNIVYSARPENVVTVIVDGNVVMNDGNISTLDERSAVRRLERDAERLGNAVGSGIPRRRRRSRR